jgi:tetratricopeptide (TPR) repeat protein
MLVASAELGDPTRRGGLFERFVTTFPDSPYRGAAYVQLAYAAQQQGNAARAVEWGTKALELNPDEPAMLVLVPDILSESGQNLDTARKLSNHLLELLATSPDKIRPPGLDDAQWDTQKQLWEGVAHSALGQMLMSEETATAPAGMAKTREAVKEFRAASPLLQPDALLYARNQYRLGFALAKVGDLVPARDALTEVVAMNSPYSPPARDILAKVQQALAKRGR